MNRVAAFGIAVGLAFVGSLVLVPVSAFSYPMYMGCAMCHPGYQDQGPLHDMHVGGGQMTSNCLLCHINIGDSPRTYTSGDPDGQGCRGCHGVDNGTSFEWGAGLREHHRQSDITICLNCHSDSPSSILPENTLPVYYGRPDVNVNYPCSSTTPGGEDWDGDGEGLDNDGDLVYDEGDPDCAGTGAGDDVLVIPQILTLYSITPNPLMSNGTEILYGVSEASEVMLRIFAVTGRRVLERRLTGVATGRHTVHFDGRDATGRPLASGVYVIQLKAGSSVATGRVVVIR